MVIAQQTGAGEFFFPSVMFAVIPLIIELIQKMPISSLYLRSESQYDRIFQTCYLSESKFALILLLCLVFVFPVFFVLSLQGVM